MGLYEFYFLKLTQSKRRHLEDVFNIIDTFIPPDVVIQIIRTNERK